jgi:hypothetical protein
LMKGRNRRGAEVAEGRRVAGEEGEIRQAFG